MAAEHGGLTSFSVSRLRQAPCCFALTAKSERFPSYSNIALEFNPMQHTVNVYEYCPAKGS